MDNDKDKKNDQDKDFQGGDGDGFNDSLQDQTKNLQQNQKALVTAKEEGLKFPNDLSLTTTIFDCKKYEQSNYGYLSFPWKNAYYDYCHKKPSPQDSDNSPSCVIGNDNSPDSTKNPKKTKDDDKPSSSSSSKQQQLVISKKRKQAKSDTEESGDFTGEIDVDHVVLTTSQRDFLWQKFMHHVKENRQKQDKDILPSSGIQHETDGCDNDSQSEYDRNDSKLDDGSDCGSSSSKCSLCGMQKEGHVCMYERIPKVERIHKACQTTESHLSSLQDQKQGDNGNSTDNPNNNIGNDGPSELEEERRGKVTKKMRR